PLLAQRYSGVAFDPARGISPGDLRSLAEAARWAPSCFGDQPWRFLFCDRSSKAAAWDKAFACLNETNQTWCQYAPLLVIACHDTQFVHNDKPNAHAQYDSGAASMSICIQATALGLMAHQMAGYSPERARELFAIPERYRPIAMMAVGYQLDEAQVPEQFRARELKPRARSPLDSRIFGGEWGKGL